MKRDKEIKYIAEHAHAMPVKRSNKIFRILLGLLIFVVF